MRGNGQKNNDSVRRGQRENGKQRPGRFPVLPGVLFFSSVYTLVPITMIPNHGEFSVSTRLEGLLSPSLIAVEAMEVAQTTVFTPASGDKQDCHVLMLYPKCSTMHHLPYQPASMMRRLSLLMLMMSLLRVIIRVSTDVSSTTPLRTYVFLLQA